MSMLITGGIGDFLALESFFSDEIRENLDTVYLATRVYKELNLLINCIYPKVNIQNTWTDFSKFPCFFSKVDVQLLTNIPDDVEDWSIMTKFATNNFMRIINKQRNSLEMLEDATRFIRTNKLPNYNNSSFILKKLCDVSFDLPSRFIVIFPYTNTPFTPTERNFSLNEWEWVINWLERYEYYGVILGNSDGFIPASKILINLNKKTEITESIEIIKQAKGYFGIDSFLSVLASKLFNDNLIIKSINPHCYNYRQIYFAPNTDFSFLMEYLV